MSSFDKIIGYEKEKEELLLISDTLKNENKYKDFGVSIPKALLIYGEAGLGKTLMANVLIEESKRKCFCCKKDKPNGDLVNSIKETFEQAQKFQPSIVFLDDMDKFAQDNLGQNNEEEFVTIQSCLESVKNDSVFVIATANDIKNMPPSLLRAGRFGRQMQIKNPSYEDTIKIVSHFFKDKKISSDVNIETITNVLGSNTCAVLESITNEAGMYASYKNQDVITQNDIIKATLRIATKEIETNNYADKESKEILAYHEVGHAITALIFNKKVGYISIKQHGDNLGVCSESVQIDKIFSLKDLQNDIIELLGGKACVELFLKKFDTGAVNDIEKSTKMLRDCIEKMASSGFKYINDLNKYDERHSPQRNDKIANNISKQLKLLYNKAKKLLKKNKDKVFILVKNLLEKETLAYDEINYLTSNFYIRIEK